MDAEGKAAGFRRPRALLAAIAAGVALLLLLVPARKIPVLDARADRYFTDAITRAGLTYTTCRVVNAGVSVLKESDFNIQPGGLGVSLALGQILDPIDDMTERLSDVLVTAIASLGVQELLYEISVTAAPPLLAVLLFITALLLLWPGGATTAAPVRPAFGVMMVVLAARLCLPVSSVANEWVYRSFFTEKIAGAKTELERGFSEIEKLGDLSMPPADGLLETIRGNAAFYRQKTAAFKNAVAAAESGMGELVENLLALTFLYAAVFLVQVILLPLLVFWLLVKLSNALFDRHFHP